VPAVAQITVSTAQFGTLARAVRKIATFVRRLALAGLAGVVLVALVLARDGYAATDVLLTLLLLVPPAIVFFFSRGLREVLALPERLRRVPGEGQARLAELTRVAGTARTTRARGLPLLLWRLRGSLGSVRDVAGFALPLRVFTPPFLALAALAGLLCVALAAGGLVALAVLLD